MTILTITYSAESSNTLIRSSRWNQNCTDITTFMNNNNINSNDNIQASGITTASLANLCVTDAKISGITTAGKVSGSALTGISGIPSGAGIIPLANLPFSSGMIVMWSGTIASIPSGWVLCNGANSTPDLRNKFIVGADADSGGVAKSTITGSALQTGGSTTITKANLPQMDVVLPSYGGGINGGGSWNITGNTANGSTGNQTFSNAANSGSANSAYTQPFYALAYIMKT